MGEPACADLGHAQAGGDAAEGLAAAIDQRLAKVAAADADPEFDGIRDHPRHELCGSLVYADLGRSIHEFLTRVHERTV
jgi:hypothetical protein